ncbi:hypothetical protein HKD37_17G047015 [Glycine soja]|uniref:Uncharacterized protein n=1 Tax=Glycine soja TaxID=3848 RepID=A0A445G3E7_GLYSO|nr:hypothetical protein D0Y65_045103 [Glycine soja]
MSTRRWPRHVTVRGRKRRAKVCLANNNAVKVKPSLQRKLRELQGAVPGSEVVKQALVPPSFASCQWITVNHGPSLDNLD